MTSTMMLADDQDGGAEQRGGRHDRQVLGRTRLQAPAADALDVEDPLGEDRAGQQGAEVDAEDRDDRHQRRAQARACRPRSAAGRPLAFAVRM